MSLSCYAIRLTRDKFLQVEDRKRKRKPNDETTLSLAAPSQKRPRVSPPRSPTEHTIGETTAVGLNEVNPLEYWRKELRWPKEYFEPESNIDHLLRGRNLLHLFVRNNQKLALPHPALPRLVIKSRGKPKAPFIRVQAMRLYLPPRVAL